MFLANVTHRYSRRHSPAIGLRWRALRSLDAIPNVSRRYSCLCIPRQNTRPAVVHSAMNIQGFAISVSFPNGSKMLIFRKRNNETKIKAEFSDRKANNFAASSCAARVDFACKVCKFNENFFIKFSIFFLNYVKHSRQLFHHSRNPLNLNECFAKEISCTCKAF